MTSFDVSSQWSQGHPAPPYITCNRNLSDRCEYCKDKGWCKGAAVCQYLHVAGPCGTARYSSTFTYVGGGRIANSDARNSIGRDMCSWLILVISERKGKSLTASSILTVSGKRIRGSWTGRILKRRTLCSGCVFSPGCWPRTRAAMERMLAAKTREPALLWARGVSGSQALTTPKWLCNMQIFF